MNSSHRLVCDLLDNRYFDNLQDVMGNVEPIPTLVPYYKYEQNVIVYKTVADHAKFMAMIQNFCDRTARQYGRELWSWAVQWEVEDSPAVQASGATPAFKKLRLGAPDTAAFLAAPPTPRKRKPHYTVSHRKLDPELMKEEDMLRITIDIVQTKPQHVPNFIEFLYRWIDFYESDATALKLAMHEEIPSLWDFEHTPLVLVDPEDSNSNETERRKPDLKAFEELAARSERLQYKEARFGLQAVKEDDPMPPLITIPKDPEKRKRYYAACYKSRSKAKDLLIEAGVTEKQIGNYVKQQKAHPKKTLEEGEQEGWKLYNDEKVRAEEHQRELQRWTALKKKCKEGLISIKLRSEADQAALQAPIIATRSGHLIAAPPIIPPTLPYALRLQLPSANRKRHGTDRLPDEPIKVVPVHLFGALNSRLFDNAIPSDVGDEDNGSENNEEEEMEGTEDEEDNMDTTPSAAPVPSGPSVVHPSAPPVAPPQGPVNATNIVSLLQSLSPAQVMRMLPLLGSQDRQRMVQRLMALPAPQVQAAPANTGTPNPFTAAPVSSAPSQLAQGISNQPSVSASPSIGSAHEPSPIAATRAAAPISTVITVTPPPQSQQLSMPHPPLRDRANAIMQSSTQSPASANGDKASAQGETARPQRTSDMIVQAMSQTRPHHLQQQSPQGSATGNSPIRSDSTEHHAHALATQRLGQALRAQDASQLSPQMAQFQTWANIQRTRSAGATNGVQPLQRSPIMPTWLTPLQPNHNRLAPLHTGLPEAIQQAQTASPSAPQSLSALLANRNQAASLQLPGTSTTPLQRPSLTLLNPLQPGFAPPLPGLKRKAPIGLSITPNPFVAPLPKTAGIPIQFYFPKIADYASTTIGIDITDALMLGYLHTTPSGDEEIEFTHLILLPMSVSQNCINRVQEGQYTVLESYTPEKMRSVTGRVYTPVVKAGDVAGKAHKAAYEKIKQAFSFMQDGTERENSLTKRWRATQGVMTEDERGSVWEGWAVGVSMKIAMSAKERKGAYIPSGRKEVAEEEEEWGEDEDTDEDTDEDEDEDMESD